MRDRRADDQAPQPGGRGAEQGAALAVGADPAPDLVGIERFRLNGQFAVWVEGLHAFFYNPSADYTFHPGRSRLAANALLVQHGDVLVRLEGKFDKATAIVIARSLHG